MLIPPAPPIKARDPASGRDYIYFSGLVECYKGKIERRDLPMMMYGYSFWWGLVAMLLPLAILGIIVYWAVYSGVRKALRNKPPE